MAKRLLKSLKFKKDLLLLFFLTLLAFFGVKALLAPGFYTSHDGEHQVVRFWHFHQALKDGQLPVRWAGGALNGFGYPLFIFTYRLPFWLAEVFYRTGFNLTDSIKAVFIVAYFASGLTMYLFSQDLWKSKAAGFFSAFLYLWAPYRFSNIFVRASLGEHVAFVFLPLVFWALWRLKEKQNLKWLLLLAFSVAGFILSHILTFQLLLPFIFLFWLVLVFSCKQKKRFLFFSLLGGLLAGGLSCFYLLPAIIDKNSIQGLYPLSFSDHFPTLKQLFYSRWDYAFSMPGENDGMAFQVGIVHWLVAFSSVLFLTLRFFFRKKKQFLQNNFIPLCFLFLYLLSIFMMLKISMVVWQPLFKIVFFTLPWRLLFISVFASSVLVGFLVVILRKSILFLPFILCFLSLNIYVNRNHLRVNKYIFNPDSFYQDNKGTATSFNEYTPRWATHKMPKMEKENLEKIEIIKGEGNYQIKRLKSNLFEFDLENSQNADINVNILYYPGWQATVDGERKEIDFKGKKEEKVMVLMALREISPGKHKVVFTFKETPLRKASNLVSLTSLLLVGLIFLKRRRVL